MPEIAARRPFTVVLIDEVESFAVRRSAASFEANPVDVHRATDAVLLGIDEIAKTLPSVLFITTTNFIQAVDEAFLSRADLVMHFELPDQETIVSILRHALGELAVQWPALQPIAADENRVAELAALCAGWDGRRIRKLVLAALAQRLEVARNPALLTWDDLLAAARKQGGVGGRAPTSRESFPDVPPELMPDHDHGHGPHAHPHTPGEPHTHELWPANLRRIQTSRSDKACSVDPGTRSSRLSSSIPRRAALLPGIPELTTECGACGADWRERPVRSAVRSSFGPQQNEGCLQRQELQRVASTRVEDPSRTI